MRSVRLGQPDWDLTHTVRPGMIHDALLMNPLYRGRCPIGKDYQPHRTPRRSLRPG